MTPEGAVKKKIKEWLESIGAYYFMPVQTGYGATTIDFLVCYRGHFIGVETKAPKAHGCNSKIAVPSARQALVLGEIEAAGGGAITVNSLESLQKFIEIIDFKDAFGLRHDL